MLYISTTFKYDFDYQPDDVYWCTADVGWITGHSYVSYGPLINGATGLIVSCLTLFCFIHVSHVQSIRPGSLVGSMYSSEINPCF